MGRYKIPSHIVPEDWEDYCVSYYIPDNGHMVPCVSMIEFDGYFFADLPDDVDMDTLVLKLYE